MVLGVIFALIFVGLQEVIKKNFPQNYEEIPDLFQNSYFFITLAIAVTVGVIIKHFFTNKNLPSQETISNDLIRSIRKSENYNSDAYKKLITSLYKKFSKKISFPRFIYIDEYERLDLISKSIVEKYLNDDNISLNSAETWIVCHTDLNKTEKPKIKINSDFNSVYNLKVLPLEYHEKLELVKMLDLDEKYADFSSVKAICEGKVNEKLIEQHKEKLIEFRQKNPKNLKIYDCFDLLYLFSLDTKPYNVFLSKDYIKSAFTRKAIRNNILKEILYNGALTKTEFENKFNDLKTNFNYLIETKKNNGNEKFRIQKITYEIFSKDFASLELQSNEKIHLFWALFLADTIEQDIPQFTSTRQLISHILKIGNSYAELEDNSYYSQIVANLYNYNILAINLSIKVCYFSEIYQLIDNSVILIQAEPLQNNKTIIINLIKKIWQIYSILHEPKILDYLFYEIRNIEKLPNISIEHENLLDKLFFELIENENIRLNNQRLNLFYYDDKIENTHTVRNYFRTLSVWFSFSLYPISQNFTHSELYKSVIISEEYLKNAIKAINRINNSEETDFIEFDFRIISLSIWSFALLYSEQRCNLEQFNELLDFIKISLDTTFNIDEALKKKKKTLFSTDYFYNSITSEIATISIATIALILKSNRNIPEFDEVIIKKTNQIIILINDKLSKCKEINFTIISLLV